MAINNTLMKVKKLEKTMESLHLSDFILYISYLSLLTELISGQSQRDKRLLLPIWLPFTTIRNKLSNFSLLYKIPENKITMLSCFKWKEDNFIFQNLK